ncbi:MAG TPA: hypothetical protein VL426_05795 [Candidatus Binatia bacterium]|nr:hypothetical protein [Candidatus Binatia bacterium]
MATVRRRKKKQQAPPFVVAVALVVTGLLLAFVLQRTLPHRESVAERLPPPEFANLLPAGAEAGAGGALELPDSPQPAYVVGYAASNGEIEVALIVWDKQAEKYRLGSKLALRTGDVRLESVPTLKAVSLGRGAPIAVLARGSAGAYVDAVFVLVRQGNEIRFVAKQEKDGHAGIAFFLSGASVRHSEDVDFGDVDGDGAKEAVVNESTTDDRGVKQTSVSVYVLKEGVFVYDEDLSKALTLSRKVFPEPTAPPTE